MVNGEFEMQIRSVRKPVIIEFAYAFGKAKSIQIKKYIDCVYWVLYAIFYDCSSEMLTENIIGYLI